MKVLTALWVVVQILVGYNLVVPLLMYLLYRLKKSPAPALPVVVEEADYAIIITAYEQTGFLQQAVDSLLNLNYSNYLIYIVADNCDIAGLHFNHPKVILLRPEETLASNIRSHFYAISHFERSHQRITIIDSDNLVHPQYLGELNRYFDQGYLAVQGVREAKNLNTTFACLDAARDIYYHFYDGKLLFNLGSSATLSGSGMAFETQLYKKSLSALNIQGAGFDKVLQFRLINRDHRIAFAENAIVYDEKTAKPDQLVKQRARWINTWFKYFSFGFRLLEKGITHFSLNVSLFGLILLRPPLFIFLLLALLCTVINLIISPVAALFWAVGLAAFVLAFFIALASSKVDKRIYNSLINIPGFIFYQLLSLLKVTRANSISVATKHDYSPLK